MDFLESIHAEFEANHHVPEPQAGEHHGVTPHEEGAQQGVKVVGEEHAQQHKKPHKQQITPSQTTTGEGEKKVVKKTRTNQSNIGGNIQTGNAIGLLTSKMYHAIHVTNSLGQYGLYMNFDSQGLAKAYYDNIVGEMKKRNISPERVDFNKLINSISEKDLASFALRMYDTGHMGSDGKYLKIARRGRLVFDPGQYGSMYHTFVEDTEGRQAGLSAIQSIQQQNQPFMTNFISIYFAVLLALATFFGLKILLNRRRKRSGNYRNSSHRYPNRRTFKPGTESGNKKDSQV